ncbi:MAG: cobalamin-binding protein [Tuberibacillus sp.]
MRIVSLCPSNTEILACLGLTDCIVGVDHYSDWPKDVRKLPDLGPDLHINMEKVKALNPDLIVASLSVPGMEQVVEQLDDLHRPYLVLEPHRLHDVFDNIMEVGVASDRYREAVTLVEKMKTRLEEIKEASPRRDHVPRLYWEWWPKPVFSPGGHNWLTDVSEIVSAVNIFAAHPHDSIQTDWKAVAEAEPDYTLAVWTGIPKKNVKIDKFLKRPEWQGKRFAQADRIHILEEGWYCRPSPRLVTGIEHLAHILYPDIFNEARSFLNL